MIFARNIPEEVVKLKQQCSIKSWDLSCYVDIVATGLTLTDFAKQLLNEKG